jgi:hypothetical protein
MTTFSTTSHRTVAGYLVEIIDTIEALKTRPCADREFQHIEGNLCNLSKALLNQLSDYQERYAEIVAEEAGKIEDNTLSAAQMGLTR